MISSSPERNPSARCWRATIPLLAAAVALTLAVPPLGAGPAAPCPDGPDPLRFRPEYALPGGGLSPAAPGPLGLAAAVDPVTGREWVAAAFVNASDEVVAMVSGNGGCSFGAASGGMDGVVVSGGGLPEQVSVALRVDDSAPLLAVGWIDVDRVVVRTTGALDGSFTDEVELDTTGRGGPHLALAPGPAAGVLAAAWLADDTGNRVLRFSTNADPTDTAAWSAAVALNDSLGADLGPDTGVALAADAAGASGEAGFTLLAAVRAAGTANLRRSDDSGANFGAWARVDDATLASSEGTCLASGAGTGGPPINSAWLGTAWSGEVTAAPGTWRIAADAARFDAGALVFDFDGVAGPGNAVQQEPADPASQTACAVAGGAPGTSLFALWADQGEVVAVRRPLAETRPNLAGGCGPFEVTGLDPSRSAGTADEPAAAALGEDLVLAYRDDRSGGPEVWFKRSDSTPPSPTGLAASPADCGAPPRVRLDWDPPACDVVQQIVEVGTAPGGTDFTRAAGTANTLLVEGLEPGTTYYFRLGALDSAGNEGLSEEVSADTPSCSDANLQAAVVSVTDACAFGGAGGDGRVDPGENVTLRASVENAGTDTAAGVTLRAQSRSAYLTVRTGPIDLGDMDAGTLVEADLEFDVSATAPCGEVLELLVRADVADAAWSDLLAFPVPGGCTACTSGACSLTADPSLSAPVEFCRNETVTLDAGASSAVDCAGIFLYEWWDDTTLVSTSATEDQRPNNSRTYRLVVTCSTDFACADEATLDVTVNQLPGVSFDETPPPPHCDGDTVTLTASTSDPAATYSWNTGEDTPGIEITQSGPYSVRVTDSNGCVRVAARRVDFGRIPPADAGPDPGGICAGVPIGTPGFPWLDYWWEPPDGLSARNVPQPTANPPGPTIYTLTVTDPANGCFDTDDVFVDLAPLPGPVTGFRVARSADLLRFVWDPDADSVAFRVYSEDDVTRARNANAASATARFLCEDTAGCDAAPEPGMLVYYQVVGVCVDGVSEGSN